MRSRETSGSKRPGSNPVEESYERVLIYSEGARLNISPRYLEPIVRGIKTSTIRDGVRVFPQNCRLQFHFSADADPLAVRVTKWEIKKLKSVTEREMQADGLTSKEQLLHELRRYYPHITEDSVVTVISFALGACYPSGTAKIT